MAWRSGSHAAAFEATVALDTVRGDKTLAYDTVSQTRARISIYIDFCNSRRPHRAHGGKTPDMIYFAPPPATHKGA